LPLSRKKPVPPVLPVSRRLALLFALAALGLAACTRPAATSEPGAHERPAPALTPQQSGTEALLIGTDAVSAEVAWAGGTGGTVLRTTDGGQTWQQRSAPGPDSLQFRDVEAMSAHVAYVLSIGTGAASRIYKTTDGGASWSLQFRNGDTQAFFDCMALWNEEAGFAFSDAVSPAPDATPRFPVTTPESGGEAWTPVEPGPRAFAGEGSFAASGTCAAARSDSLGWIGTGNAAGRAARVLRTADRGRTWQAAPVPIDSGEGAGVTSLVFRPGGARGWAFGGDIGQPARTDSSAARTADGGRSWQRMAGPAFEGPVYGAARVPGTPAPTLVAVGPGGASYSRDGGRSWAMLDTTQAYWGVAFAAPQATARRVARTTPTRGWIAGPDGRLARVRFGN
jgi:photosystem II stability/assembly factor-like uncharacterized protein